MKMKPEIQYSDIVLIGDFNPVIFSPTWFACHDLIGETEAESAEIQLIHSDVSIFSLSWLRMQITRERFSVFTEHEAYFPILRDLVIGAFRLLSHTPIKALGLNRGLHFKFDSEKKYHNFGHFLAPQSPWKNIFEDSGMLKLEVVEKNQPKDLSVGSLRIRVEPSSRVHPGVFFNVNKHFEKRKDNRHWFS